MSGPKVAPAHCNLGLALYEQGKLMERDPLYCDVIVARDEAFSGQKARRRS